MNKLIKLALILVFMPLGLMAQETKAPKDAPSKTSACDTDDRARKAKESVKDCKEGDSECLNKKTEDLKK